MDGHLIVTTSPATQQSEPFAVVYAEHRDAVLRLAMLLCGDRELAEDVTADAFARTWPRWERGDVDDVGAYLRRAAVNGLRSQWRRRGLRRDREQRRVSGDDRGTLDAPQAVVDRDAVLAAVRRLPERQRAAVVLRFYEDRPTHDIAAVLGVTESSVRTLLQRASRALEQELGGQR